ncbi:MAG TPA: DNA-binding protein [Burkholderiaceae bacterium]|nr:DNA-binding protein [Burkholderiaceae bacterium]
METLPIRLLPGQDLRRSLETAVAERGCRAAFVLSGIGSLSPAVLRLAGASEVRTMTEDVEILTLAGSIAQHGSHLHASVSDARGAVVGGHLAYGCLVRTTAEVLLALLPDWTFTREPDAATGWDELVVRRAAAGPGG